MIATILGDIIGITYEHHPVRDRKPNFSPLFHPQHSRCTDDTVLSLAVASAILRKKGQSVDYQDQVLYFARKYPKAGFGGKFQEWFNSANPQPYYSYANGGAMRVGPVGWAFESIEEVLAEAKKSAEITHSHPEGIKGAQAIALAVFLARKGKSKAEIKDEIQTRFYNLDLSIPEIITTYTENKAKTGKLDTTALGNVPQAIVAFLESTDVESAIRIAVSLGGDADTLAAMAGSIAEAFYQNDQKSVDGLLAMVKEMKNNRTKYGRPYLDRFLLQTTIAFYEKYIPNSPVIALLKSTD